MSEAIHPIFRSFSRSTHWDFWPASRTMGRVAPAHIISMSHAVQLCGVPKLAVIRRKSCGQAYINMGGGRDGDEMTAWTSADVNFMDRRIGVGVLDGSEREDDPARRVARKFARPDDLAAHR